MVVSELDIDVVTRSRWWAEGGKYRDEVRIYCDCHGGTPIRTRADYSYEHPENYTPEAFATNARWIKSLGFSLLKFDLYGVPQELVFDFAKGVTGFPITRESWRRETGPRIVTLQKALLLLGGPDVFWELIEDDDNPPRFYEPLPSGPYKGRTTDRELVDQKRGSYFETLGWDERGVPLKETLDRLGIGQVWADLQRL